jgi:ABC-type dipeptide/oligopeptide/nickel transport system ATPase subunit
MGWDGPDQPEQPEQPEKKAVGPEDNKERPVAADQKQDVDGHPSVGDLAERNMDEKKSRKTEILSNGVPNAPESPNKSKGISNKALRMPAPSVSLSGGQMQRVAISRAFMRADKATLVVLE